MTLLLISTHIIDSQCIPVFNSKKIQIHPREITTIHTHGKLCTPNDNQGFSNSRKFPASFRLYGVYG